MHWTHGFAAAWRRNTPNVEHPLTQRERLIPLSCIYSRLRLDLFAKPEPRSDRQLANDGVRGNVFKLHGG